VTTFTDFAPTATSPFQFAPTLDGNQYTVVVTWGLAGQRWYINLYDKTGALVVYLPLIASPDAMQTISMMWNVTAQLVTITTLVPHDVVIGSVVTLTVSRTSPAAYNGVFEMTSSSPSTLTYPQATDPGGSATIQGIVGRDINIVGGYFDTSTLVFRESTQQFEVSP
jgi:hypothetical protein